MKDLFIRVMFAICLILTLVSFLSDHLLFTVGFGILTIIWKIETLSHFYEDKI